MQYNPLSRIRTGDPTQAAAWEEACRIAGWLKGYHPDCTVRAFGSLVRPNAWSPRSDIDIAVSGISGFSWDFAWKVHEEFPKFEVQVVSADPRPSEQAEKTHEFSQEFIEEILATGIEIPAAMQMISCEPELIVLARRIDKVAGHMTEELQNILESEDIDIPDDIKCSAAMFEANRYRYRMERVLDRVVGFIDRLKPECNEETERLRIYNIAANDVTGLRPALITPEIAKWHSKFIEREYRLMDPEEGRETVVEHREQLPEIHRKTIVSFSNFRNFLIACHAESAGCRQGISHL